MSQNETQLKLSKALIMRKERIFSELTRISQSLKTTVSRIDAEVALHSCLKYEDAFEKVTDEIYSLNAGLSEKEQISTKDFDTFRVLIDSILKKCYGAKDASDKSVPRERDEAALPKLNLPIWDGEVATWIDFKTQFDDVVHNRQDISENTKLRFLRSSLKGEPLSIVNHYYHSKASYELAYLELVQRYESSRRLASYHLKRILNFKHTSSSSGKEHIHFLEIHRAASSVLSRLEIDLADFILFELSYKNLSATDRIRFELDHNENELPTMKQLLSFVEKIARSEEYSVDDESLSSVKGKTKISTIKKSLVVSKRNYACFYCKGDHMLYRCPEILALPVGSRKAQVKQLGCCVSCLYRHPKRTCKSKFACKVCGSKYHNTILHPEKDSLEPDVEVPPSSSPSSSSPVQKGEATAKICNNCLAPGSVSAVLLGTIQCHIQDVWGRQIPVRAVLDPGSEISVITSSLANRLGLPKLPATCQVEGIGQSLCKPSGNVRLQLSPINSLQVTYQLQAAILPEICDKLPKSRLSSGILERFGSLELADPQFYEPSRVHLLLGVDVYSDLLSDKEPTIIPGNPAAIRTIFGYVIMGRVQKPSHATSLCLSTSPLDDSLKRFWEIEEGPREVPLDPSDALCERHFQETYQRDSSGRFVVRLPFLSDVPPLGNNKDMAMKRLKHLERKFSRNSKLEEAYTNCLQEYIDLGHISIKREEVSYLLPHHAVIKESSSTTKYRVVFDCSAPDDIGLSLNDRLFRGPPLLNDISLLLINFRLFKICLMADIKMMYRMVVVHPDDRKNLVIVWRDHQYQMNRLPFGLKPAGYIAGRCLVELANLYDVEFPAAAKAIRENRYADDFCIGAGTLEEAKELQGQLTELLSRGGFEIRRWSSNAPDALSNVPELFKETPIKLSSGEMGIKVLGVMWDQVNDAFVARVVPFDSQSITKRTILSYIARIYDVMGFFSPTIFMAKYFIQRLWLQQLDWDQPLPSSLAEEWKDYANEFSCLADIRIPRLLPVVSSTMRLVGFSDASEKGMAAAVYLQWSQEESSGQSRLLKSKTKLAPLKTLTIPRLELCGALLLANLIKPIVELLENRIESINLYTDSKIVLAWLNHSPHELKIFVGNRVAEIHRMVPSARWGHVNSSENPADLGSRGLPANLLKNAELWWNGPQFLSQSFSIWPGEPSDPCTAEQLPDIKVSLNLRVVEPADHIIRRFSSFSNMQRVLAYMCRFINKCRRSSHYQNVTGPLSSTELQNSLYLAIKMSQKESFGDAINKIKEGKLLCREFRKLSPFFDYKTGLVRVGGRLGRASFLPEDARHPFLLSKKCHLATLICDFYHKLFLHSGPRTTCAAIQRKFWISSLMTLVKGRILQCRRCHKLSAKPGQPFMADIIPSRLDRTYCWASCAVDFGGPFATRESKMRKSTVHKSYMCLFICLTTRAIHLEMVTDLTASAFLAAFQRFTSRRSVPSVIYSDRGTNFVCARRILRECGRFLVDNQDQLLSAAAAVGTKWLLNAPYGPNFNGSAENGIKSAKALLKRQVGEQILTFEEFSTLLCRIEQVLNSRPISFSSSDINDRELLYLTPGHFITGREMMTPAEMPLAENVTLFDRWKRVQHMAQTFWKTWSTAYLHELMQRNKWNKATVNLKVGDLVYVTGMGTTPLSWPIGRVEETFTNPTDSTVRVVRVKVRGHQIIRPVNKLVVIPMEE